MTDLLENMNDPAKFTKIKEFFFDWMRSEGKHIITPEEPLMFLPNPETGITHPLYKRFLEQQNAFFAKFWEDYILPSMTPEIFLRYVCLGNDLPENFTETLENYAASL